MHKVTAKMKMARRLLSQKELSKGVSPHNGKVWVNRAKIISKKESARAKVNQK
jgi:hypothetical protein